MDSTVVVLRYPFDQRKSHTRALMSQGLPKTLEDEEYLLPIFLIEADAVVLYENLVVRCSRP